jgi:hypothetical protein
MVSPGRYAEPEKEGRSDHEEEVASNRRPPLRGRILNGRSSCRFRALLPRAICLSRLSRTFVAFGLTWALVDSVNSFRTVEAQPGVPYCRFSSPAWLTARRENRKPEAPWQCLSYSVKDIDGHVVAVSYRGQEKRTRSRADARVQHRPRGRTPWRGRRSYLASVTRTGLSRWASSSPAQIESPRRWRPTATACAG